MPHPKPPTAEDRLRLLTYLGDGCWHKAAEIRSEIGMDARTVRSIAEDTAELLGGNDGYKRADLADRDEVRHTVASLRSRAEKLADRASVLESMLKPTQRTMGFCDV